MTTVSTPRAAILLVESNAAGFSGLVREAVAAAAEVPDWDADATVTITGYSISDVDDVTPAVGQWLAAASLDPGRGITQIAAPADETDEALLADHPCLGGEEDAPLQNLDLAEFAWGVIANVSEGNWEAQTEEWCDAARRWRDNYHAELGRARVRFNAEGEGLVESVADRLTADESEAAYQLVMSLLTHARRLCIEMEADPSYEGSAWTERDAVADVLNALGELGVPVPE